MTEKRIQKMKQAVKKFEELTFSDQFMFGKVMSDSRRCRKVLETLVQKPVGELHDVVNEKHMKETADGKAIRLDIFTKELDSGALFDAEMQNRNKQSMEEMDLPKRSRFYQSEIDVNSLEGKLSYRELKESNIIFICTFDPMGRGEAVYDYEYFSKETPPRPLGDGTHRYFFNCTYKGTDIPEELQNFYRYIRSGEVVDELTKEINEAVKTARRNGAWRDEYMRTGLYLDDAFHEGKAVGREEGREEAREEQRILLEQERKRAEEAEAKADELAQEVMELKKKLAELK